MFRTTPKARLAYSCNARTSCPGIQPGQRYVREAVPPWTLMQDDPDSPPAPTGEWWVRRFHAACQQDEWFA